MKMSLKKKIVALLSVATLTLMVGCSSTESKENSEKKLQTAIKKK